MNKTTNFAPLDRMLLAEIVRLGGEERSKGAEGALEALRSALCALVLENPEAYGAGNDADSQQRAVDHLISSLQTSFLAHTVSELRHTAGYILVLGYWVHRAVFTFIVFGLLVAIALPVCAVSLMSTLPFGWVPGVIGIVISIAVGIYILIRVRR